MKFGNQSFRAAAGLTFSLTAPASAQWSVVNLHPSAASHSYAYGMDGSQQVGVATVDGVDRASLWTDTAASWVSLHPAGAASSEARGVSGGKQVGWANVGGVNRARLWSGSAASAVNLHPSGASQSEASATDGGQQVGYARFGGVDHAGLWTGSASSWVDLHPGPPSNPLSSYAYGVHGGTQVGATYFNVPPIGPRPRASLWSGTSGSWTNLHNAAFVQGSEAVGVHDGQQVGYAPLGAGLWSGTAGSWVALTPVGSVWGVHAGQQVGVVYVGDASHAALWSGTAGSLVDLHAFAPTEFAWTVARGVWHHAASTSVVGYGYNTRAVRIEALMWLGPGPCYPDCNADSSLSIADFSCFQAKFAGGDPYADCTQSNGLTIADFACFQSKFVAGCP